MGSWGLCPHVYFYLQACRLQCGGGWCLKIHMWEDPRIPWRKYGLLERFGGIQIIILIIYYYHYYYLFFCVKFSFTGNKLITKDHKIKRENDITPIVIFYILVPKLEKLEIPTFFIRRAELGKYSFLDCLVASFHYTFWWKLLTGEHSPYSLCYSAHI